MSSSVCLVERSRGGDRIDGALLATGLEVSRWAAPSVPADDALAPPPTENPRKLARWIAGRLGKGERLGLVVLDAEGSLCAWMRAPSAEKRVVEALVRGVGDDHAGSASATLTLGPDHELPGGADLEPLAVGEAPERLALLSVPDAAARVLIDELDRAGQGGAAVISVWHALADAWDPAADKRAQSDEEDGADQRFVGESEPLTAVVAIDPRGRLLWSWSDGGKLLAAGALRLSVETAPRPAVSHERGLALREGDADPGEAAPVVRPSDVSRLAADWLGWSAQLGVSPGRVVAVVPRLAAPDGALSGAELGAGLGRAWPGASVDLAVQDDPMQATLDQLLRRRTEPRRADGREALSGLSARPGRDHRAMYRWSAAALLLAAAAVGVWAYRVSATARETSDLARSIRQEWMAKIEQTNPDAMYPPGNEIKNLKAIEDRATKVVTGNNAFDPALPILRELDDLSWIIGNDYFELEEISLSRLRPTLKVVVDDIGVYEDLRNALADGSSLINWTPRTQERGDDRIGVSFAGRWTEQALRGEGGGAP